jgi:hypothetical protein
VDWTENRLSSFLTALRDPFLPSLRSKYQTSVAQVGIEVTALDAILHQFGDKDSGQSDEIAAHGMDYYCQKMLDNFFNYGESFVREHVDEYSGAVEKVIPAKVFEKWYANFQTKLKNNPSFWKD